MNLQDAIAEACKTTPPQTKQRNEALSKIKWRLRSGLLYAGLRNNFLEPILTDADHAYIFDGRDNEEMKLRYYGAALRVTNLEIELI